MFSEGVTILSFIKKLIGRSKAAPTKPEATLTGSPRIIPRSEHRVSRQDISDNALKVLKRLNQAGFAAYLVGGGVRDLLLRHAPKDFDVATNAHPNEIRSIFRNCRLIGRRFRLAHVHFGREIIEVATFRGGQAIEEHPDRQETEEGMLLRDNVFGNMEEDAFRRDFTVNALYYNIADFSIVDYTGGFEDLEKKQLRLIGEPLVRFNEDPVRMLRVVRFMAKLAFTIDAVTEEALLVCGPKLQLVPPARLFEEILKLFQTGIGWKSFLLLKKYGLFALLFPSTQQLFDENHPHIQYLLTSTLKNTDQRIHEDKPVTPAFLFAALLWYPMQKQLRVHEEKGIEPLTALEMAMEDVLRAQLQTLAIPKRLTKVIREIWILQFRLPRRYGKRAFRVLTHPRFRAGYDLLILRVQAGEEPPALADWWSTFQSATDEDRLQMVRKLPREKRR